MLKQIDFREKSVNWTQLMPLLTEIDELPIEPVRDIIKQVRESGDDALRDLTKKFDGILLDELRVDENTIEEAYESVPEGFKDALNASAEAITRYQKSQLCEHALLQDDGLTIETVQKPVSSAGCYVPGG